MDVALGIIKNQLEVIKSGCITKDPLGVSICSSNVCFIFSRPDTSARSLDFLQHQRLIIFHLLIASGVVHYQRLLIISLHLFLTTVIAHLVLMQPVIFIY